MYRVSVPNCESIACHHSIPYSPRVNIELYRVHCTPPRINRWIPFHTIITICRTGHVTRYTVPNCESITGHHSIPILTTCQLTFVPCTLYPPRINRWIPIPRINPEIFRVNCSPSRISHTEKLYHTSTQTCTGYTVPNHESIVNTYQYYTSIQTCTGYTVPNHVSIVNTYQYYISTPTCTGYIVPQLWINY